MSTDSSDGTGSYLLDWVHLNVGGTRFLTTKATLCKRPESFLHRLVCDDPDLSSAKDESGSYLIDRDPAYFSCILNYLRHGKLIINKDLAEEGVLEEAEFYNLPDLVQLAAERIKQRDQSVTKNNINHVYRVLQCQEGELSQMLSTFTDGWKCEQVISMSQYSYGSGDQGDFLVVMSKDVTDMRTDSSPTIEQTEKAKVMLNRDARS
ncbi:BTB/POZ domain-containing protein KCTD5-like [Oscarella lobularis]|uniref:BTB/POZ domain-containing protein KCTD5-like n=1 Tax=Oscarella lobularis TaxID=121494 RepID=UPI003313AD84